MPFQHRVYSYVDRGFYSEQLRRLWTYFPREQVMVLRTEELRKSPIDLLKKVWMFLGLNPQENILPREVHSRSYSSPMEEKEKEYLANLYEYEIKNLERILGWDCSEWLNS